MKTLHSVIAIGLVGCLLALPLVEARASQQTQDRPEPALVKQCLKQLGKDTKVTVKLANGAKLEGRLGVVGERKFQLSLRRLDPPRHIDYNRVVALSSTEFAPPPACVELGGQWLHSEWDNLRQVSIGDKVEVVRYNLSKHKGKMLVWTEESISLRLKNQEVTIPREDVYRVTWLSKSRRGRNALIGLVVGAGVGAVLGANIRGDVSPGDPGFMTAAESAAVVSLFFGGIGAGVGAAIPSHPTIYRAPRRKPENRK